MSAPIEPIDPICYLLMRSDLASLNPGKAMAQAVHASDVLRATIRKYQPEFRNAYLMWQDQAGEFGTVITLAASESDIVTVFNTVSIVPAVKGWVEDPTYPLRDGEVTHYFSLKTCGFLFGNESQIKPFVNWLPLHP